MSCPCLAAAVPAIEVNVSSLSPNGYYFFLPVPELAAWVGNPFQLKRTRFTKAYLLFKFSWAWGTST